MSGTPFPFPKSSTPGSRPGEGEGRYVNCEPVVEGGRTYIRRVSGLALLVNTAKTGIRGMLDVNGVRYIVWTGSVTTVTGTTVATLTGTIPGTAGVTLARNNKVTGEVSTPDVVAVREDSGAYVLTSTTVSAYPDADLPTSVNSVDFLGGYFLFSLPDGRLFASQLNSTDINALSFTTAESRADGLKRVAVQGNIAYAMGASTIEPYLNVGLSPFPLQRAQSVEPVGLLTTMAVAGLGEGWDQPIYFVASDKTVKSLSGYDTAPVSTPDVDRFITASTVSAISMLAFVDDGRPYVVVSSDAGSWRLNVRSGSWVELDSVDGTGESIGRWRASQAIYSGGVWVLGDSTSGKLFTISDTLTEDGNDLGGFIQSGPLKDFPARVAAKLSADFTEAAITIYVSWSHDGGKTRSIELERSLANAEKWPLSVSNLGLSTHHGIIVRFRWTGAADFSFSGAAAERLEARAA